MRLTIFNNEPMARLAEQRLRQAGIPSLSRALRGGPGLWGSSYNLPHDLYVYQGDEMQAREVLDLAPQEIEERERQEPPSSGIGPGLVVALIIAAVLVLAYHRAHRRRTQRLAEGRRTAAGLEHQD